MRVHSFGLAMMILTLGTGLGATAQMGSMPMEHTAKATVPSTNLVLQAGEKTITLSAAELLAMPHETVSVVNGHSQKAERYSGVPVEALLAKLGMPFEKANEPTLLRSYLVAKGTDGYVVVVSVYETLAAVHGGPAIVADSLDGKSLEADGAFKLVLSTDKRPQRWVRNLASLKMETAPLREQDLLVCNPPVGTEVHADSATR